MTTDLVQFSDDRHLDDLKSVQGQLTLANIMTPRRDFICCTAKEPAQSVMERISPIFDAIPVIDSNDPTDTTAEIIGLLYRDKIPYRNRTICAADCADTSAASKAHSVDKNLLVYTQGISGHPVEFVTDGRDIVGLVTPFDLERLPVRIALFALIIDVERLMGTLVMTRFPDTAEWEQRVSPALKTELRTGLARSRGRDSVGQAILSVGFGVKLDLLTHCFAELHHSSWFLQERHEIRLLRNNVAHGAPFPDVMQLPSQVRNLFRLRSLIAKRNNELRGQI